MAEQRITSLIKRGTPLINRLRKRKTTVLLVTNVKDNPKSAKFDTSEGTGSSMISKKRRRE
jgi:hypothetical protein